MFSLIDERPNSLDLTFGLLAKAGKIIGEKLFRRKFFSLTRVARLDCE